MRTFVEPLKDLGGFLDLKKHALKEKGLNVDTEATTIAEAVETISKALNNR